MSGETELSSPHTLSPHPSPLSPHPLRGGVGGGVRGRGSIFLAERIILTPPPAPPLPRGGESGKAELSSPSQGRGERRNGTPLTFPRAGRAAKRNSPPLKGRGRGRGERPGRIVITLYRFCLVTIFRNTKILPKHPENSGFGAF